MAKRAAASRVSHCERVALSAVAGGAGATPDDVTFDESVPYYRLFPYRTAPLPPPPLFLAPGPPPVDPLPPQGPAPSGVSQVDTVEPVEVAVDSGAARGAEPEGAELGGAESGGAASMGAEPGGAEPGGAEPGGAGFARVASRGTSSRRELLSSQELREWFARRWSHAAGAGGTAGAGGSAPAGGTGAGGAAGAGARATGPGGARPGGTGATGPGGGATSGAGAGGTSGVGATGGTGAGAAVSAGGPGGTRTGGNGAAGTGGAAGATGVGPAGGAAGASGNAGAAGPAGAGAAGATGAGAAEGVGAGVSVCAGAPEGAGVGDVGACGATGAGAAAGGTGAVPAGSGGAARPRPYFVPLLEQVLGLPPSTDPPPPLACPQPVHSQSQLQPASPLPAPSPYTGPTGGLAERREPTSRPASPVRAARTSRRAPCPCPPPVPGTHQMALRPSTAPLRVPLLSPTESSLPFLADPESDSLRAASPTVTRLLATVVIDPSFESTVASALVAELVDFAARCRLVAESASASICPPSVGGECSLSTDVLEDKQEEFQCFAAALPHLSAMDAEMASWKSTGTYVGEVPPPGANIGLVLGGRSPVVLTGHADVSWVDDLATQRSSQGYTFSLGFGSVSWRSTRSSSVLSSSCEAEIYAGAMAAQELRWLTYLLTDLGEPPRSPPVLYVDNKAMLALCREHRLEHRTKHIALCYFLARELQQRGQLRLAYVASESNTADIFTKALPPGDHQRFCTMLGLVPTWPHLLTS
ncbi:unnamed protein product [Closterium sp. NIES-54]